MTREELNHLRGWCQRRYKKLRPAHYGHPSHLAGDILQEALRQFPAVAAAAFGVEGWCDAVGEDGVQYLNLGETYEPTVCFRSDTERFFVSAWGDAFELWEQEQEA